MIGISVPMAVRAYHDPYHGRTFHNAMVLLIGVCGVIGPVAFFIAETQVGVNAAVFWVSICISAVAGVSWFIGFWIYVIMKIAEACRHQTNARRPVR